LELFLAAPAVEVATLDATTAARAGTGSYHGRFEDAGDTLFDAGVAHTVDLARHHNNAILTLDPAPLRAIDPEVAHRGATRTLNRVPGSRRYRVRVLPVHGPALAPLPYQPVHEGDRPPPDLNAMAEAAINQARTDRAAAHQLPRMLTFACSTLARFEAERAFLHELGIPARFLPSARELGRTDLV